MDKRKKTESLMRYVIYALCGLLLVGIAVVRWGSLGELSRYLYLILGVVWTIYGGVRALKLRAQQRDEEAE